MPYLLTCNACQSETPVEARHAGELITCSCGTQLEVPTLRKLRQLPQQMATQAPGRSVWSRAQGVTFALGLLILALAAVSFTFLAIWRSQLITEAPDHKSFVYSKDLMQVSPTESWDAWVEAFRDEELGDRPKPMHIFFREADQRYRMYQIVSGIAAAAGIAAMIAAFFIRVSD